MHMPHMPPALCTAPCTARSVVRCAGPCRTARRDMPFQGLCEHAIARAHAGLGIPPRALAAPGGCMTQHGMACWRMGAPCTQRELRRGAACLCALPQAFVASSSIALDELEWPAGSQAASGMEVPFHLAWVRLQPLEPLQPLQGVGPRTHACMHTWGPVRCGPASKGGPHSFMLAGTVCSSGRGQRQPTQWADVRAGSHHSALSIPTRMAPIVAR